MQNITSITPKALNTVNVFLGSFIDKLPEVINHQMLTKALQRLIASKGVRIAYRTLAGMALDIGHEGLRRDRPHYLGIGPSALLQQAKNDAFTPSASASMPLTNVPLKK